MLQNSVKQLRKEQKLTQEQLGKKVNVTRQTVAFIEKGVYDPSVTLAIKISNALGKDIGEVFWIE
ncbi:helix-turn-helix transcriptional regulator [Virgibacillus alimentarius]|uniref:Transcriptional regulator n=1 Tax=Virgibacillus alimentarius TaxID=698769 RepID=A0ABS4S8I3_9BACI|nr:helix-turn-helix transcriptional regulator [Virgibacillus alimentarius]MBP2257808.1 putative transcriptional regulator [Virgibacillus alimentarius]